MNKCNDCYFWVSRELVCKSCKDYGWRNPYKDGDSFKVIGLGKCHRNWKADKIKKPTSRETLSGYIKMNVNDDCLGFKRKWWKIRWLSSIWEFLMEGF